MCNPALLTCTLILFWLPCLLVIWVLYFSAVLFPVFFVLLCFVCLGQEDFISLTAVCFTPATVYLNRSGARTTTRRPVTTGNCSTRSCYAEPGATISTYSCSHGKPPDTAVPVVSAGSICCWKCGSDHSDHSKHSHARYLRAIFTWVFFLLIQWLSSIT